MYVERLNLVGLQTVEAINVYDVWVYIDVIVKCVLLLFDGTKFTYIKYRYIIYNRQ